MTSLEHADLIAEWCWVLPFILAGLALFVFALTEGFKLGAITGRRVLCFFHHPKEFGEWTEEVKDYEAFFLIRWRCRREGCNATGMKKLVPKGATFKIEHGLLIKDAKAWIAGAPDGIVKPEPPEITREPGEKHELCGKTHPRPLKPSEFYTCDRAKDHPWKHVAGHGFEWED